MAEDSSPTSPEAPMDELIMGIIQLLESDRMLPAMMLLFNAIEIYANLGRSEGAEEASEEDFMFWVKSFLLPRSGLPCTAEDLCAARISLARHLSPELPESRLGKARKVMFEHGAETEMQELSELSGMQDQYVAVPVGKLLAAFIEATADFEFDCSSDPAKQRLLEERVARFCGAVPSSRIEQMSSLLKDLQAESTPVEEFREFLLRVGTGHVTVGVVRNDANDLFYVLIGRDSSTGEALKHIREVGDETVHGERELMEIKAALKASGATFRKADFSEKNFGQPED